MLETDAQRRGFFARLHKRQRAVYPMHTGTRRSRRNRALAIGVGVGVTGGGLVLLTHGGARGTGPFKPLLGETGRMAAMPAPETQVFKVKKVVSSTGKVRKVAIKAPSIVISDKIGNLGFVSEAPAEGVLKNLHLAPGPIQRLYGASSGSITKKAAALGIPHVVTVRTIPVGTSAINRMKKWLPHRIERANLWNIFGRGELYRILEDTQLRGEHAAQHVTKKYLKYLANKVESPVVKVVTHGRSGLAKGNVALAGKLNRLGGWLVVQAAKRGVR